MSNARILQKSFLVAAIIAVSLGANQAHAATAQDACSLFSAKTKVYNACIGYFNGSTCQKQSDPALCAQKGAAAFDVSNVESCGVNGVTCQDAAVETTKCVQSTGNVSGCTDVGTQLAQCENSPQAGRSPTDCRNAADTEIKQLTPNNNVTYTNCGTDCNLQYVPLAPLPGEEGAANTSLPAFLSYLLPVLIVIGGVFGLGTFAVYGFLYMISEVANTKTRAKQRIWASIYGLVLLLGCVLILRTINPNLTTFDFSNLTCIGRGGTGMTDGTCQYPQTTTPVVVGGTTAGSNATTGTQSGPICNGSGVCYTCNPDGSAVETDINGVTQIINNYPSCAQSGGVTQTATGVCAPFTDPTANSACITQYNNCVSENQADGGGQTNCSTVAKNAGYQKSPNVMPQ